MNRPGIDGALPTVGADPIPDLVNHTSYRMIHTNDASTTETVQYTTLTPGHLINTDASKRETSYFS